MRFYSQPYLSLERQLASISGILEKDILHAPGQTLIIEHHVTVAPNGPAAQAGLQPGDVIVQADDKAVTDVPSLGDALVSKNPDETVVVQGYRDAQHLMLNVKPGELSAG